jgi:hypothetical protein
VRTYFFCFISLYFCQFLSANNSFGLSNPRKTALAAKTTTAPIIDGIADDPAWLSVLPNSNFTQFKPVHGANPSFRTEVKIMYDDAAIYILAQMYDPHPDSILRQLGLRDEDNLNADMFSIEFDTYNNQLDAYSFLVTASGVQIDWRESDETYDAVWESEVVINNEGWVAELKIPYSALRFARTNPQVWGMQISRSIRRYRESDQWALEILEAENDLPYWGLLEGIENIEPPVRLSATPYLVLQAEHFPDSTAGSNTSTSFGGGMDLKYGINESFTLDISLLPDFSQVQSDNKIKNLSAFETVFEEQRPFFKEAVDLFMKGNIFYSRRIGKTPALFYSVSDSLEEGEYISKNPVQQRLINATKISGRNKRGLAIGFLNALTANTYATAIDEDGNKRKILTDPLTNYNLIVIDQALKNNSDVYITNTNVLRGNNFPNANVTASGFTLNDKSNTYRLNLSGGLSQIVVPAGNSDGIASGATGFKYGFGAMKTKGNFQFEVSRFTMDENFDANDMGLTLYNNYNANDASVSYNFYKPFWLLREMNNTVSVLYRNNFTTHKAESTDLKYQTFMTTLKYLTIWAGTGYNFAETYDYYEPRTEGMYYVRPKNVWGDLGFSTDYRKLFALDGKVSIFYAERDKTKGFFTSVSPIVRLNDHLKFTIEAEYYKNINDFGFSGRQGENVIFGNRDIDTYENSLQGNYLFMNNVSLSMVVRHYYSQGKYYQFYTLLDDGSLQPNPTYEGNADFTFNSFNVDMVFAWIFAPGSSLNFVWKNEITTEKDNVSGNYFNNFTDTFNEPQRNNISLKVLYYIDYQRLRKGK